MISLYKYNQLPVRTEIDDSGAIWFAGIDVCNVLGYQNANLTIRTILDEDERKMAYLTDTLSRKRQGWHISEAGLYSLILQSSKPEAKAFKRWITHEVIPAIRKAGIYSPDSAEYKESISQELMNQLESVEDSINACKQEQKRLEKEKRSINDQLWDVLRTSPNQLKAVR